MSGFGSIDKTGDGLCLDEFVEYLYGEYKIKISKESISAVFQEIEGRNKDDERITWPEWQEFLNATPFSDVKKKDLEKLFEDADTDGSGKLSFRELLPRLHEKGYKDVEIQQAIAKYDKDNDQEINKCEWMTIVEDILAQNK